MKNEHVKNLIILLMVTLMCSVFLLSCDVIDDKNSNAFKIYDITPPNNATDVSRGAVISVTFSNEIDGTTATDASVLVRDDKGNSVAGKVSAYGICLSFTPTDLLASLTTYTVTIKTLLKDTHGRSLGSDYTSSFTTEG
jgi:hypothetical protein